MGSPWLYAEFLNIMLPSLKDQGFTNPGIFVPDFKGRERNFASDLAYLSQLWEDITSKEPQAKIVLAGDGSGGLLALSLLFHITFPYKGIMISQYPLKKPFSVLLISPWTKLFFDPFDESNQAVNDWADGDFYNKCCEIYLGSDVFKLNKEKCNGFVKESLDSKSEVLDQDEPPCIANSPNLAHQISVEEELHPVIEDDFHSDPSQLSQGEIANLSNSFDHSRNSLIYDANSSIINNSNESIGEHVAEKIHRKSLQENQQKLTDTDDKKYHYPDEGKIDIYMNPIYCKDDIILRDSFPEVGMHIVWGAEEWLNDEIAKLSDKFKRFGKVKAEAFLNQAHDFPIIALHAERIEELREDAIMYITGILSRMLVANTDGYYKPGAIFKVDLPDNQNY